MCQKVSVRGRKSLNTIYYSMSCLYDNLEATGCPGTTEISMIVSIFLSLSNCALDIFATGKHVHHRDEYGFEIATNLQFLFS